MTSSPRTRAILSLAWLRADEYDELGAHFGASDAIVEASRAALEARGLSAEKAQRIAAPDNEAVAAILDWADADEHWMLMPEDESFPPLLRDIPDRPLVLYVTGHMTTMSLPCLAIVGSRNPTAGGVRTARDFARHLGSVGLGIVSGLAEGIDAAAHEGALQADAATVAVMGTGIDRVYPAKHRELAHRIAARGALVTEYPPGTPPRRQHFPERNRLITGMALGVLVVEAARQSGSLISARLAAEQGREVFAIPGSIHNPLSRGCHALIRQGAKLVETSEDIVTELGALAGHLATTPDAPRPDEIVSGAVNDDHMNLLNRIGFDPVSIDELATGSGLTIAELSSMLLIPELEGKVDKLAGRRYVRSE